MTKPDEPTNARPNDNEQEQEPTGEAEKQPRDYPDMVNEASDDSFPASDPPSSTGSTATLEPEGE